MAKLACHQPDIVLLTPQVVTEAPAASRTELIIKVIKEVHAGLL